jgi:predicted RNase H-like HicB family nuclease
MEELTMANRYNISLLFYPQLDGQYHVVCPDLPNCFTCGATMAEARERIYDLIGETLTEQISASETDEEMLRLGLCMEGKMYQEIKVTVNDTGEVIFPGTKAASAA